MKTTGRTGRREAEKRLAVIMEPFLVEDEIKTLQNVKARIEGAKDEWGYLPIGQATENHSTTGRTV